MLNFYGVYVSTLCFLRGDASRGWRVCAIACSNGVLGVSFVLDGLLQKKRASSFRVSLLRAISIPSPERLISYCVRGSFAQSSTFL